MKILVINGSPKGANSITLQTINFLQKRCPEHTFEVLHAGQRIKALKQKPDSQKSASQQQIIPKLLSFQAASS